jgi:hypothetical protein
MPPNDRFDRVGNALHAGAGTASALNAESWHALRRNSSEVNSSNRHTVSVAQARKIGPEEQLAAQQRATAMAASVKDHTLHQPMLRKVRPRHYLKGVLIVSAALCGHLIGRAFGKMLYLAWRRPFAVAAAFAISALAITLVADVEPEVSVSAVPAPTVEKIPETWSAINRPIALYGLHAPELERLPHSYTARRHVSGMREDALQYGSFANDGHFARVVFTRDTSRAALDTSQSYFIHVARRAAETGLAISRLAQATPVSTKFGAAETSDSLFVENGIERACLAFRLTAGENLLGISGWLCGTQSRPADRGQLSCLIDRLTLVSAGDDQPLKTLFAAAERRRDTTCPTGLSTQAGRKVTWIDPQAAVPALRVLR